MSIRCGSESRSVLTWRRMPGSRLIMRSGRSARSARKDERLPRDGKRRGIQLVTTTKQSRRFHASER